MVADLGSVGIALQSCLMHPRLAVGWPVPDHWADLRLDSSTNMPASCAGGCLVIGKGR